ARNPAESQITSLIRNPRDSSHFCQFSIWSPLCLRGWWRTTGLPQYPNSTSRLRFPECSCVRNRSVRLPSRRATAPDVCAREAGRPQGDLIMRLRSIALAVLLIAGVSASARAASLTSVDVPTRGATVPQTFLIGGWAIDRAATTSTGVSPLHISAYPATVAPRAASFKPDVIMFNEIEKNDYWGNQDQPEVYKALLQQKTGKTWYYVFAQEFGQWTSNGKGNLILSTYPLNSINRYELLHNYDRSVALAQITVNGRNVTLAS